MDPDITIYNAATGRPVLFAHSPAGKAQLEGHYGMDAKGMEWVCTDRTTTAGNRGFRKLHEKITAAGLAVRNDQASAARLDRLTGGEHSATVGDAPSPRDR